jgi:hypothetical protein
MKYRVTFSPIRKVCRHYRMVVGFITTYAIGSYHHLRDLELRSWQGILDPT